MREDAQDGSGSTPGPYAWWRYVGELDGLLSAKYPDTIRHLAVRAQFATLMLDDRRIVQAVNRVRRRTLQEAAFAVYTAGAHAGDTEAEVTEAEAAALAAFLRAFEQFTKRLFRSLHEALWALEAPYLRSGFRWPWLLQDIGEAAGRFFLDQAMGRDVLSPDRPMLDYGSIEPHVPLVEVKQLPGESRAALIARVRGTMSSAPYSGKRPSNLERQHTWAEWFYRRHALGEGVAALARERHERVHADTGRRFGRTSTATGAPRKDRCDCRATVTYGIKRARYYLEEFPKHGVK